MNIRDKLFPDVIFIIMIPEALHNYLYFMYIENRSTYYINK